MTELSTSSDISGRGKNQTSDYFFFPDPEVQITFTSSSGTFSDVTLEKKRVGQEATMGSGLDVGKVNVGTSSGPSETVNTKDPLQMSGGSTVTQKYHTQPIEAIPGASTPTQVRPDSPSNSDIIKALHNMNQSLKGEISSVTSKLAIMSSQITKVENDLQSYENRWEARVEALSGKISQLEKGRQSLENRWDMHRRDQGRELATIQTGIDSNSSAILEIQNKVKLYQEKWDTMLEIEACIKDAAEKKFQLLKTVIQKDITEIILEVVRSLYSPNTTEIKEGLEYLQNKLSSELQSNQNAAIADFKEEIREVKHDQHDQAVELSELKLKHLKQQSSAKKNNLIVFGLIEEHSPQADRKALMSFFKERMGLPNLVVTETYRLGQFQAERNTHRPLVVKFQNIQDRWIVWNRKGSIKKV